MSYFDRPDSPPPREPSPEPVHTPLPSPHLRARDRRKQQQQRTSSPLVPPGLAPPRTLLQSRSCDQLTNSDALPRTLNRRTRSNLEQPVPTQQHRRTVSISPPPHTPGSSSRSSPVPPVPPLPDSARTSPLVKPHLRPQVTPIYLPELNDLSPVAQRPAVSVTPTTPASSSPKRSVKRLPSLFSINGTPTISTGKTSSESTHSASSIASSMTVTQDKEAPTPTKQKSVAMTCLKFFTIHRHASKQSLKASQC